MSLSYIFKLSRPRFWMYTAGPFFLGAIFSGINNLDWVSFLIGFFYFIIFGNLLIYSINDIFDYETDIKNPKKSKKEVLVNFKIANIVFITSIVFSFLYAIYLKNNVARIIFLGFLFFSIFYSAKPIRFKTIPFLDSSSNILYAIPGFLSYYIFSENIISIKIFLAAYFWVFSMHLYSAIPDIEYDKKSKTPTTATFLGFNNSLLLCGIFWLFFSLIMISYQNLGLIRYLSLFYPVMIIITFFKPKKIDNLYWLFPYLTNILGFLIVIREILLSGLF